MQGYFKKKTQNAPRPSEHPTVVGGKKQTQNTQEAWDTTQFLEFAKLHLALSIDVDVILGTCSTLLEIITPVYVIISSTYQNTPEPSGHTNIKAAVNTV